MTTNYDTAMARQARKQSGTDTRLVVCMNLIVQPSYKKMNRIINAYIRCGRITARTCSLATEGTQEIRPSGEYANSLG